MVSRTVYKKNSNVILGWDEEKIGLLWDFARSNGKNSDTRVFRFIRFLNVYEKSLESRRNFVKSLWGYIRKG